MSNTINHLKIKELRVKKNLTQKEFYTKAGKLSSFVSLIEKGLLIPPMDLINALSDTYNVPISYFYGQKVVNVEEFKKQRRLAYGHILKNLLIERNITEAEFGKKIGKKGQAINRYKNGKNLPPEKIRDNIEKVLAVKIPLLNINSFLEKENIPYSIDEPEIENIASESTVKYKRTPPPSDNIYIAEINKRLQEQEKRILELEKKLIDK